MLSNHTFVTVRWLLVFFVLCSGAWAQQTASGTLSPASQRQLDEFRKSMETVWMNDFGDLSRYRAANADLQPPAPQEDRVVFLGDSITDMWPLDRDFPGKPYINRGISGQTTPQMLIRFRPDVIELQPKVVVILAGTNDIAGNTGPMRIQDIEGNLASMAELARLHGIAVVLSSVLPVNNYSAEGELLFEQRPMAKILTLNAWLKRYCAKNGDIYLDYFSRMVDDKGLLRRNLSVDGLHPSKDGFAVMTPLAEAAIRQALGSRQD